MSVWNVCALDHNPLAVSQKDNGTTLTAMVGQDIVMSLAGNPTTGYSWDVKDIKGDAVERVGEVKYKADAHPPGMVGVGGGFTAKFKAAKPGKATVTLEYRRPWEKNAKAAETFEVTISVAGK